MTDKQKHTPGPWRYMDPMGDGLPAVLADQVTAYGNFYVAQCNVEADARLIAAAPDLLAALRGLLSVYDRYTNVGLLEADAARAAIARAESAS